MLVAGTVVRVALKMKDALCVEAGAVFGCHYVQEKMYSDRDISDRLV